MVRLATMTKKDDSKPSYLQDTAASRGQSVSSGNRRQSGGRGRGRGSGRGKGNPDSQSKSLTKKCQAKTPDEVPGRAGAHTPASGVTRDGVSHSARPGSSSSDPLSNASHSARPTNSDPSSNMSHDARPTSSSSDPLSDAMYDQFSLPDALYDQFRGSGLSSEEIRSRYNAPRGFFGESPRPTDVGAGTSTLHVDTGLDSTITWQRPNSTASAQSNVVHPTELDFGGIDPTSTRSDFPSTRFGRSSTKRVMLDPEAPAFTPILDAAVGIPVSGHVASGEGSRNQGVIEESALKDKGDFVFGVLGAASGTTNYEATPTPRNLQLRVTSNVSPDAGGAQSDKPISESEILALLMNADSTIAASADAVRGDNALDVETVNSDVTLGLDNTALAPTNSAMVVTGGRHGDGILVASGTTDPTDQGHSSNDNTGGGVLQVADPQNVPQNVPGGNGNPPPPLGNGGDGSGGDGSGGRVPRIGNGGDPPSPHEGSNALRFEYSVEGGAIEAWNLHGEIPGHRLYHIDHHGVRITPQFCVEVVALVAADIQRDYLGNQSMRVRRLLALATMYMSSSLVHDAMVLVYDDDGVLRIFERFAQTIMNADTEDLPLTVRIVLDGSGFTVHSLAQEGSFGWVKHLPQVDYVDGVPAEVPAPAPAPPPAPPQVQPQVQPGPQQNNAAAAGNPLTDQLLQTLIQSMQGLAMAQQSSDARTAAIQQQTANVQRAYMATHQRQMHGITGMMGNLGRDLGAAVASNTRVPTSLAVAPQVPQGVSSNPR